MPKGGTCSREVATAPWIIAREDSTIAAQNDTPERPDPEATPPALRCKLCGTRLSDTEVANEAQDVCTVCCPDMPSEDDPRHDPYLAYRLAQ